MYISDQSPRISLRFIWRKNHQHQPRHAGCSLLNITSVFKFEVAELIECIFLLHVARLFCCYYLGWILNCVNRYISKLYWSKLCLQLIKILLVWFAICNVSKSLPNLMLKLKYLLFSDVIHINEIKLPHKIIAKNLHYINWANYSFTTEVTLSLSSAVP